MAVKKLGDGGFVVTEEHIDLFNLIRLRGALKLQERGIRMSRGLTATKVAAHYMGVPRTNVKKALEWVNEELKKWEEKHNVPTSD